MIMHEPLGALPQPTPLSDALNHIATLLIVVGILIFGPFAIVSAALVIPEIIPLTGVATSLFHTVGIWLFFTMAFVLGYWVPYVVICGGIGLFTGIVIASRGVTPMKRVSLVLVAITIGIFVFAPYRPAVSTADGVHMVVATEPPLWLRGLKRAQAIGEITPCEYEVLGWHERQFYYKSRCALDQQRWSISVNQAHSEPWPVDIPLPTLVGEKIPHTEILDLFRAEDVYPESMERSVRELYLRGTAIVSPDEEWVAIVARHLYGAEDVLIVHTTKQSGK